jgi:hypothetical protein
MTERWMHEMTVFLDQVAGTKKREDQLRRTTRSLHLRTAKGIEVDGGIFENL